MEKESKEKKAINRKPVKKPVTKGVAKVPVVMQLEALECGAAALAMVMAYYGLWVPLEQVRLDCGVSRDGSKARNIYLAAENYGFKVQAFRMSPEALKESGTFPCIIHWNMNHFVVLDGFKGNYAYINDPARGQTRVTWEEFDNSFTGVTIVPVPSENFVPGGKRRSTLDFARKRLRGAGPAVVFVMLTTAIAYLFGIVNSVTGKIFMDRLLSGTNPDWLYPFTAAMLGFALLQIIVEWAQAIYSLKISGKMDVIGSTTYMWKVLRLPMEFFSQRMAGAIQTRAPMNASIAGTLVDTFAPVMLNTVMMVVYLVLMLNQSVLLTAIGLITLALNLLVSRAVSKKRIDIARLQIRDSANLESATVTGIEMIETIKSSGAENGFFKKWAGYQASLNSQAVAQEKTDRYLGMIPVLLSELANFAVMVVGVYLTMQGRFTVGAVFMFQGFLGSFMAPAMTLVNAGQTIFEMRSQMECVEDVMEYRDDVGLEESEEAKDAELRKLSGKIELKDVTFGYSRLEEPLIRNLSLTLEPGSSVALVGASGCGKSTISKLISGLHQPWSGEILFDGKPRSSYPREVMVGSLAVVDQEIILFEDTVANNIKMWDNTIMEFEMILAARDAGVHDDIMKLPGGYQHRLSSGGRELSGGQRQRLEIARVLAQDPTVIILDEATSALDAVTEYEVVKHIRERGITCIVIAHRLSTVRDCDQIVVLDHGIETERGTHDELMKKGGAYAELVSNE